MGHTRDTRAHKGTRITPTNHSHQHTNRSQRDGRNRYPTLSWQVKNQVPPYIVSVEQPRVPCCLHPTTLFMPQSKRAPSQFRTSGFVIVKSLAHFGTLISPIGQRLPARS